MKKITKIAVIFAFATFSAAALAEPLMQMETGPASDKQGYARLVNTSDRSTLELNKLSASEAKKLIGIHPAVEFYGPLVPQPTMNSVRVYTAEARDGSIQRVIEIVIFGIASSAPEYYLDDQR